ncbi:hypothetical protein [Spiroplasma endosymbiont of Polydrusus formosus]|uniref:hypothetical protein n=1 Tax=Spiroplasma endosymbiont of Polydrusus formosus TaxID=3139326 RepID=UPI0035B50014
MEIFPQTFILRGPLNENYYENIQKILKELIKNNQLDPLRMTNNKGIIKTDYFETQDKKWTRR